SQLSERSRLRVGLSHTVIQGPGAHHHEWASELRTHRYASSSWIYPGRGRSSTYTSPGGEAYRLVAYPEPPLKEAQGLGSRTIAATVRGRPSLRLMTGSPRRCASRCLDIAPSRTSSTEAHARSGSARCS